jgi:ankyrin repeat protein
MEAIVSNSYLITYLIAFLDIQSTLQLMRSSQIYYEFIIKISRYQMLQKCKPNYTIESICRHGNEDVLEWFISTHKIYKVDYNHLLLESAEYGNLDMIHHVVKHGANIHHRDDHAFIIAAENNHLETVKYLLDKGAPLWIDFGDDHEPSQGPEQSYDVVVYHSAMYGNFEMFQFLIKDNIDTELGWNCFISAASHGHLNIVCFLVDMGIPVYMRDDAMSHASMNGQIEIVKYFLEKGVKVDYYTLLNSARNHQYEIIKFLIENGRDIKRFFIDMVKKGDMEMVRTFMENGADIHMDDEIVLQISAYVGHYDLVRYFVKLGSDIHACNDAALWCGVIGGNIKIVRYLVRRGVDIHACDDVPLWCSVTMCNDAFTHEKYRRIVYYLLRKGANINALYNAIKTSDFQYATPLKKYLGEKGIEICIEDNMQKYKPFNGNEYVASYMGSNEIFQDMYARVFGKN